MLKRPALDEKCISGRLWLVKLSVILPVYNTAPYLVRCLDSLIGQTLEDYEIIVINDGSTDDSESIIFRYLDQYQNIRYFKQDNLGVSHSRNIGLAHAKGEYITFADSDDWVDPPIYSKLIENLTRSRADLAVCGFVFEPKGRIPRMEDYRIPPNINNLSDRGLHNYLSSPFSSMLWNKIYKASIINRFSLKFPENIHYGEDSIFNYNYINLIDKIFISDDALYHYFFRQESLSHHPDFDRHKCQLENARNKDYYYHKWGLADICPDWDYEEKILDIISSTITTYILGSSSYTKTMVDLKTLRETIRELGINYNADSLRVSRRSFIDKIKLLLFKSEVDILLFFSQSIHHLYFRLREQQPKGLKPATNIRKS